MNLIAQLGKPDVRKLVDSLEFDEDTFTRAVMQNPKLYLEAGKYRVLKMGRRATLQHRLDVIRSEKAVAFRSVRDKGGRKETEGAIHDRVNLSSTVQRIRKKLDKAYLYEEFAKMLLDSYKHRQSALKIISDVRNAEIANELRSVRENISREGIRERSKKVRKRLSQLDRMGSEDDE